MLSTLRWAGKAVNANSLADPNATFDPTLPCASGEEAARDALVYADVPKSLEERQQKKPQEIGHDCLFENAESILRFYEEDIILHVIKQEVKDKRVYKLLQRGEDDTEDQADMARVARSSYLGKNPFGDKPGMDEAEARALSPLFMEPPTSAPLVIALGSTEGDEFHRQAEAFSAHLVAHGVPAPLLDIPFANHWSIVDDLASPDTALHRLARTLMGV